jgi:WD40 repeat protein
VVRNFQGPVFGIAWSSTLGGDYLITGCGDGSVHRWQVIEEEDNQHRVLLRWIATNGVLTVKGTSVQDVRGLSHLNNHLLKQRGATGEPEPKQV